MTMLTRAIDIYAITNFYGGLNLADSPNSLAPTQAMKLQNFSFSDGNVLEIRGGNTLSNSLPAALGTLPMRGVWRYGDNSSNYYLLGVSNGYFYDESQGYERYHTVTSTTTTTADAVTAVTDSDGSDLYYHSDWQPYITNVYHSNGADEQMVYNNTAWANGFYLRRTGCPVPTATTTGITATTGTASGEDIPLGVYKFLWTLELSDGSIICEGNPNAVPATATLSAAGKITVSITDPDPEDLRQTLNLYATDTDGDVYYYLTSMPIVAGAAHSYTWEDYTLLDTGTEIETDNYRPPIGTCNRIWGGFQVISGVAANPHYVYFSKYGRLEQFPGNVSGGDPVSSAYIIDCEDRVMGMEVTRAGLIVICENSTQLVTGYSAANLSKVYLSKGSSCIGKRAIALGNDGKVYWVGRDNVYATNGESVVPIGRLIWSELKALTGDSLGYVNCFFYNSRFYISYPSSTSLTYCDRLLELDTRYGTSDESGNTTSLGAWLGPHKGINITCFAKTQKEAETEAYYGDGSNPYILKFGSGSDDNGTAIEAEALSGIIYVGAPLLTKRYLAFGAETKDCTSSNTLTLIFDNGKYSYPLTLENTKTTDEWLDDTSESASDDPVWTEDNPGGVVDPAYSINWSGEEYDYFKSGLPQEAVGDCIQMKLHVDCKNPTTLVADRSFAIRNMGLMYSVMRRFWR